MSYIGKNGYKYLDRMNAEHRIIVERFLGRKLKKGEVIHHINNNKLDNRTENLKIMTKTEHHKFHSNNFGKEYSRKMSKIKKKWVKEVGFTAEHRRKISESKTGSKRPPVTEETRKKLSRATKRYWNRIKRGIK
jgi:hypothetical protein